jgi:hypothetical protein
VVEGSPAPTLVELVGPFDFSTHLRADARFSWTPGARVEAALFGRLRELEAFDDLRCRMRFQKFRYDFAEYRLEHGRACTLSGDVEPAPDGRLLVRDARVAPGLLPAARRLYRRATLKSTALAAALLYLLPLLMLVAGALWPRGCSVPLHDRSHP